MYKSDSRNARNRRNITKESEVYPSNVYQIGQRKYKRNKTIRRKEDANLWKKTGRTFIGTMEYIERRPGINFGLFAIAQLFAGAGPISLIAVGILVLGMTLTAAKVYSSREFIQQGLAICGGLAIARIIQLLITALMI